MFTTICSKCQKVVDMSRQEQQQQQQYHWSVKVLQLSCSRCWTLQRESYFAPCNTSAPLHCKSHFQLSVAKVTLHLATKVTLDSSTVPQCSATKVTVVLELHTCVLQYTSAQVKCSAVQKSQCTVETLSGSNVQPMQDVGYICTNKVLTENYS